MKHLIAVAAITLAAVAPTRADTLDQVYVITKSAAGTGPELLVEHAPAAQRANVQSIVRPLLDRYRKLEAALRAPADDPAAALALFVVGNVASFRHTPLPDDRLFALLAQVRAAIGKNRGMIAATQASAPAIAQQYAIVGALMMGMSQDANPRLVQLGKDSARNYMRAYLDLDVAAFDIADNTLTGDLGGGTPPPTTTQAAAPVGKIETVSFQYTMQMGVGGYFYYTPEPVVLFKGGDALTNMAAMLDPSSKQTHPGWWTTWRANGGRYEIATKKGGWTKLDGGRYDAMPAGTKLERAYSSMGGGGNTAYGGNVTIASWRSIKFDRSGRFTNGGGTSISAPSVGGGSTAPATSGTYEISGYTLTLRYDNGQVVRRAIVVDHKGKAIWLDGTGYTSG